MYDREPGAFGPSSATLTLNADGSLTLMTGAVDTGTGSFTILQQIVAEEFQLPLESVHVVQGDTDTASWEVGAGGSRLTHMAGQSALLAVKELKDALIALAARYWGQLGQAADSIQLNAGQFLTKDEQTLNLAVLAAWGGRAG